MRAFGLSRMVWAGLRHHAGTHAGAVAATAVAAGVLFGALCVGDSVRHSLHERALDRVGRVRYTLGGSDRFFGDDLVERMGAADRATAVVAVRGSASFGRDARVHEVQVFGVAPAFFEWGRVPRTVALGKRELALGAALARRLGAAIGDEIVLRIDRPSALPKDVALSVDEEGATAIRARVVDVVPDESLGAFSLHSGAGPVFSVFFERSFLESELGLSGRANLVLGRAVPGDGFEGGGPGGDGERGVAAVEESLRSAFTLDDAELEFREIEARAGPPAVPACVELRSPRVFLDAGLEPIAERERAVRVLTYFVNSLSANGRSTPYSTVAGIDFDRSAPEGSLSHALAAALPVLADGEIALTDWCAADLGVKVGDTVSVAASVLDHGNRLVEKSQDYRCAAIVPLAGVLDDRSFMPEFPGLIDSEHCADWEPGIPVDLDRIRDVDEKYWDEHRGAPKAWLSLGAAQSAWANRFGTTTAVRLEPARRGAFERAVREELAPADFGLVVRDLESQAVRGSAPANDFGGLFLSLSSFLLGAGLVLLQLLFTFGLERRSRDAGTLRALGYSRGLVLRLLAAEALCVAAAGTVLGALLGIGYSKAVLAALGSVWSDAVGGTPLSLRVGVLPLSVGAAASFGVAVLTLLWTLRNRLRREPLELLRAVPGAAPLDTRTLARRRRRSSVLAVLGALGAVVIASLGGGSDPVALASRFFGAGTLLLLALVFGAHALLHPRGDAPLRSLFQFARRNAARRPGRSVATLSMLAAGSFLVVAVGVYQQGLDTDPFDRESGTGGFAFVASTALPLTQDLDTASGRATYGLQEEEMRGISIVPMRVHEGDEASCLNLGSAQRPRILGVDAERLASRGAFSFAGRWSGAAQEGNGWQLLVAEDPEDPSIVPVIGDEASVTWALHRAKGDVLETQDDRGRVLRLRIVATLAGSLLQGSLLMDERRFQSAFPADSGYRSFLIDTPRDGREAAGKTLSFALGDLGLELVRSEQRLAEFQAVQNGYLLIFQTLGALGLLLGTAGLGLVVLRNLFERRGEIAAERALGYTRGDLARLILGEQGLLLLGGLGIGGVAAAMAVLPLGATGGTAGLLRSGAFFLVVGVLGGVWVSVATAAALRGNVLDALRRE